MKHLVLVLSLVLTAGLWAQTPEHDHRSCGTMQHHEHLMATDASYRQAQEAIENHTQAVAKSGYQNRAVITIPVVVHVVYNTTAENISDAQIQSQLTVLNADFRKTNADASLVPSAFASLAADAEIQFCLAKQDPNGASHSGIIRKSTTKTSFSTDDKVKYTAQGGSDAWPASKYLNLWVCDLGTSLLGYAQFPGGAAATDGVVCHYLYFGTTGTATAPFNKGRTATHEVGHWLNLRHIWGDANCGSDLVSDTPTQQTSNYGCPSFPKVSCSNGPNGDMFMNYMDYTDDACMYMFSGGQKSRMKALFATGGSRASLATSTGCVPGSTGTTCGVPSGLASSSITSTGATLSWAAVASATNYSLQYKTTAATTWTTLTVTGTSQALTGLTASTAYTYQVRANCGTTSSAYSTAATFTTSATSTTCTDTYESNNTSSTAKTIALNANITAKIGTSTDKDWFKFNNSSSQKNIKITLTNLPADYDVRLYNPSGTQVGISQNTGTANETILYNGTSNPVGTYKVQVYGYNGAFSANACYTLKAQIGSTTFTRELGEEADIDLADKATQLFPNPTTGTATLRLPAQREATLQIHVFDFAGNTVLAPIKVASTDSGEITLDLSAQPAGMYFVRIIEGDTYDLHKLLIAR